MSHIAPFGDMLQWREAQVAKVKVHAFILGLPEYFLWNVWNFLLAKFSVYTPSSVEVLLFAKAD